MGSQTELNRKLYEAQQARRILDRLVGYMISPLLWEKVRAGLSAGRVQSVALRLICEREEEIHGFEQQEYWTIEARLSPRPDSSSGPMPFSAQLIRCKKKKCVIGSQDEAERHVQALNSATYRVSAVEKKQRHKSASPPFITSTLQQDAARRFHYSAKQTMSIAQRLYEGIEIGQDGAVGLITYMRTDSTRLSQDAVQAAREFIREKVGRQIPACKAGLLQIQAERPRERTKRFGLRMSAALRKAYQSTCSKEQLNLYTLIWKRFVACQMAPALINQTTIDIQAGDYTLRAIGSVIVFPGFLALYEEGKDDRKTAKPREAAGPLSGPAPRPSRNRTKQHFTQPPPRYTEATLIKTLEELGIGRPSTYATIISTVVEREYVLRQKQRLFPTELGMIINRLVSTNFPNIVDVKFTAGMEKDLDEIEHGGRRSQHLLSDFYGPFSKTLNTARKEMTNLKGSGLPTELKCPRCTKPLAIRLSRNGPFLACSGYPQCSFTSDYERDEKGTHSFRRAQAAGPYR